MAKGFFESIADEVGDMILPGSDSSRPSDSNETDKYGKTLDDYTREAEESSDWWPGLRRVGFHWIRCARVDLPGFVLGKKKGIKQRLVPFQFDRSRWRWYIVVGYY